MTQVFFQQLNNQIVNVVYICSNEFQSFERIINNFKGILNKSKSFLISTLYKLCQLLSTLCPICSSSNPNN